MPRETASGILVFLLLVSALTVAFHAQPVRATGTIHIRADGSIDPPTAPLQVNDTVYTLIGEIDSETDGIVVERDNVLIDGNGHMIQGVHPWSSGYGIFLTGRSNVTIRNCVVTNFETGINLDNSHDSALVNNTFSDNLFGVNLQYSPNNILSHNVVLRNEHGIFLSCCGNSTLTTNVMSGNTQSFLLHGISDFEYQNSVDTTNTVDGKPIYYVSDVTDRVYDSSTNAGTFYLISCNNVTIKDLSLTHSGHGILLWKTENSEIENNTVSLTEHGIRIDNSNYNTFVGNNILSNHYGMSFYLSNNNRIHDNNFVYNNHQVWRFSDEINLFDDSYPSGGNYWSGFNPSDVFTGLHQNETGSDKIGDIPYIIDANNTDNYPLIYPYGYIPSPDFNHDGIINIIDVVTIALTYVSMPGMPYWKPYVDLNQDGRINILDLVVVAVNFGKQWPPPIDQSRIPTLGSIEWMLMIP